MNPLAPYRFVVQDHDGNWHTVDFQPFQPSVAPWFSGVWRRLLDALEKTAEINRAVAPGWVKWKPWEWFEKVKPGYEDRKSIVATVDGQVIGFLNLWTNFPSKADTEQMTLYIEHIAASPWNQDTSLWLRRYRHVGLAMLAYAVWFSRENGCGGRLSLHASDTAALEYYRYLASKRSVPMFHPERTDILGPTPHGRLGDGKLTFLETTTDGALNLLEDYRDE